MNLIDTLKDPNIQKFLTPLGGGLLGILLSWAVNQWPSLKDERKKWVVVKLTIEVVILVAFCAAMPEAIDVVKSSKKAIQLAGSVYIVVWIVLLALVGLDVWKLASKKGDSVELNLDDVLLLKNRKALMDKVQVKIDNEFKNSLYQAARMDLNLEERPVTAGLQFQVTGREPKVLPRGTRLFDRLTALGSGGTLLVIGEPGGGKTALLMELAQDLLTCTDARQFDQSIPVVLNLSSWGTYRVPKQKPMALADWIVEELLLKYQLSSQVGRDWLAKSGFMLLLDGFDQVQEPLQESCVAALKQFRQEFGTIEMVVCSRIANSQKLRTTLVNFQTEEVIQPLEELQIEAYLNQAGELLQGIRKAFYQDQTLLELARTPLFLQILSLTYPSRFADELLNLPREERLKLLFDQYIEQMFQQRPMSNNDQQQKMIHWLHILAQQMGSEQDFLIERIQPKYWLKEIKHKRQYRLVFWIIYVLFYGLFSGLFLWISYYFRTIDYFFWIAWFILIAILSLKAALRNDINEISFPVEAIKMPTLSKFKEEMLWGIKKSLSAGLFGGLSLGLIFAFRADIQVRVRPNQGVWNSLKNIVIISAFIVPIPFIYYGITSLLFSAFSLDLWIKNSTMIATFLLFSVFNLAGINDCIKHLSLRLLLYYTNRVPWNFVSFFKQAEIRLLIKPSGGSYSFANRYLQEHFASLVDHR